MSYTSILELPTIRNLREARATCHEYGSVITAGPDASEVGDFNHPDHKVVSFADTTVDAPFRKAPTREDVRELISWGVGRKNLLIHCHAGISRSTAIAWGVAIGNGMDEREAIAQLVKKHPMETEYYGFSSLQKRSFSPNMLIVKHMEDIFGYKDKELLILLNEYGVWN